jgi:phage/plasmid-like protein (TIGR03299 family)
MAHGIIKSSDFAFVGEVAWHSLGLTPDSGEITRQWLEQQTTFCHHVHKRPYQIEGKDSKLCFYLQKDDGMVLREGVGKDYKVLQCNEILDIAEPLMERYHTETAGILFNGLEVFIVFKLRDGVKVGNNDLIDNYVVLWDSRSGRAPKLYLTPVRVVCNNTLQLSLSQIKAQSRPLRHTGGLVNRINDSIVEMGILENESQQVGVVFSQMLNREIDMLQMIADCVISSDQRALLLKGEPIATKTLNTVKGVMNWYENGIGQDIAGMNTAWKAYNGLTGYFSHEQKFSSDDAKLNNLLFGTSGATVQKTMDYCLTEQRVNRDLVGRLHDQLYN